MALVKERRCWSILALNIAWLLSTGAALGRDFTFLYQTTPLERGEHEYEQWVTWSMDKDSDPKYSRLEFRQEFEHGISNRLQFAVYFATWRYTRTDGGSKTVVHDTALELLYNLSDPATSAFGVALYGEVKLDSELFELEAKLLLEKRAGPWTFAYNGVIEAEWEKEKWAEDKGEIAQLLGASYEVSPRLSVGGEFLYEVEIEDWEETGDGVVYAGPNVAIRNKGWWATVTALVQITSEEGEPNMQLRSLIGLPF